MAKPEKRVRRGYGQRYDVFGEEGFVAGDVSANDVGPLASAPALLEACKGLLDDLWEAHQEERDTNHHGDGPEDCIYCGHMKEAEAAINDAEKGA